MNISCSSCHTILLSLITSRSCLCCFSLLFAFLLSSFSRQLSYSVLKLPVPRSASFYLSTIKISTSLCHYCRQRTLTGTEESGDRIRNASRFTHDIVAVCWCTWQRVLLKPVDRTSVDASRFIQDLCALLIVTAIGLSVSEVLYTWIRMGLGREGKLS